MMPVTFITGHPVNKLKRLIMPPEYEKHINLGWITESNKAKGSINRKSFWSIITFRYMKIILPNIPPNKPKKEA